MKMDSSLVLSIGPAYNPPKGGVAQVILSYRNNIFDVFKYVTNSTEGFILWKVFIFILALMSMLLRLMLDGRVKIVHIHTASYRSFRRSVWFVNVAKAFGKKVILHIHGGGFRDFYQEESNRVLPVLKRCDVIITLSTEWARFFHQKVGLDNVRVVPNIVESPDRVPRKNEDGKFHLLFLGHISRQKGIFDLLDVLVADRSEFEGKLVLDIAGGAFETELLKQRITMERLEGLVCFHGWVTGNDKTELLSSADAFILPSYIEGVPISILEAESYGLPIISTKVGGIPEVVRHGENGFLFEPGDKDSILKYILKLMCDRDLCCIMSKASSESVSENMPFNVKKKLFRIYDDLLKV